MAFDFLSFPAKPHYCGQEDVPGECISVSDSGVDLHRGMHGCGGSTILRTTNEERLNPPGVRQLIAGAGRQHHKIA